MKSFSLMALLGLVTIIAMGIGYTFTQKQIEETQLQIDKMRRQFSLLDPGEPDQIKGIALPLRLSFDNGWKISLPEGNRFVVNLATDDIPPGVAFPESYQKIAEIPAGEYYVFFRADHWRDSGNYHFRWIDIATGEQTDIRGNVADLSWLRVPFSQTGSYPILEDGTTFGLAEQPFLLMKKRKGIPGTRSVTEFPDPCPGILIWIEKKSN